jgi:hypothetical protein
MASFRVVEGVAFDACGACGSIVAEDSFLARTMAGEARLYDDSYWEFELSAARERCFGNSIPRVAELFLYARRPIRRFLDVSAGAGYLLDAVSTLMPGFGATMRAIEPFPPPERFRSRHPGYQIGFLADVEGVFDAGTCIEVIEHIPPAVMWDVVRDLGRVAAPESVWYFNSAQPHSIFVREQGYLDPHRRGHIASYSVAGLRPMFAAAGFALQALPGRDWAFLAIKGGGPTRDADGVLDWVWRPVPENMATLESEPFGNLLRTIGTEAAVAYAMNAIADARATVLAQHANAAGAAATMAAAGDVEPEALRRQALQLAQALDATRATLAEALATRVRVPGALQPALRALRRWRSGV